MAAELRRKDDDTNHTRYASWRSCYVCSTGRVNAHPSTYIWQRHGQYSFAMGSWGSNNAGGICDKDDRRHPKQRHTTVACSGHMKTKFVPIMHDSEKFTEGNVAIFVVARGWSVMVPTNSVSKRHSAKSSLPETTPKLPRMLSLNGSTQSSATTAYWAASFPRIADECSQAIGAVFNFDKQCQS